jgi:hypothetical protein
VSFRLCSNTFAICAHVCRRRDLQLDTSVCVFVCAIQYLGTYMIARTYAIHNQTDGFTCTKLRARALVCVCARATRMLSSSPQQAQDSHALRTLPNVDSWKFYDVYILHSSMHMRRYAHIHKYIPYQTCVLRTI